MKRSFHLVDVFGQHAFSGNPLAVVLDANDLSANQMQSATRWLNLSEATFVLPPANPKADYSVRIFTLEREMPFAGHPTLGSCHAWLSNGGQPQQPNEVIQECGVGLVKVRQFAGHLAFAAPPLIRSGPVDETKLAELASFLGIERLKIVDASWADNGPGWIVVLLESAERVLELRPAMTWPIRADVGVVGPHSAGASTAFELRAFFTDHHGNVREDPVTGSLNASVAQWLFANGRAEKRYVASQGSRLGRSGRIYIEQDEHGQVWVGGKTVDLFVGHMTDDGY
jgi:PhzF family phenazine biosynthesis protein